MFQLSRLSNVYVIAHRDRGGPHTKRECDAIPDLDVAFRGAEVLIQDQLVLCVSKLHFKPTQL